MNPDVVTVAHHAVWVQWNEDGSHTVECSCEKRFRRERLADAVVALERHQAKVFGGRPPVVGAIAKEAQSG